MNIKTMLTAMAVCAGAAVAPAYAQSGNFGSGSGVGGNNTDNVSFSVTGNQVVITGGFFEGKRIVLAPGQSPEEAIEALIRELESSGGLFGGLQSQAIRDLVPG